MTKKKTKTKSKPKAKKSAPKPKKKSALKAKTTKSTKTATRKPTPVVKITKLASIIPAKKEIKKPAPSFDDAAIGDEFSEEVPVADTFHADDFDTSRKEFEEGYIKDEEDDEEDDEDDLYADDETTTFESYDDDQFDLDDEEDEVEENRFAKGLSNKKKKVHGFDEE